jgi:hypothetical protein
MEFLSFMEKKSMHMGRIIASIGCYYGIIHFLGCIFIHISAFEDGIDIRNTWMKRLPVPQKDGVRDTGDINDLSEYTIYISSLEFQVTMLSHMVKGDMSPVNLRERVFLIFVMVIYYMTFAFIFGNLVSMVAELIPENFIQLNEKFHHVMSLIKVEKIPL